MGQTRSGAAAQAIARPADYYTGARLDVAALVPAGCRRVLEVGCGEGNLGRVLKERGCHVTGLELVPEVAAVAARHLDDVRVADVEADGFPFAPASFDAVIFADVLEHLVDPWRVLREAVELLAPGGCVIASTPNLQHHGIVWGLLRGRWRYRARGITDFGHLRFFTLQTIRGLFEQSGLSLVHVGRNYRRTLWRRFTSFVTAGWARGFYTSQYLVVGKRT
jgi:SAM-dependent methyltransferase